MADGSLTTRTHSLKLSIVVKPQGPPTTIVVMVVELPVYTTKDVNLPNQDVNDGETF